MTTTHVAGPAVDIDGRIIQRCAVCGQKLCDSLDVMAPINKDASAPEFATWAQGAFVCEDEHCWTAEGNFFEDKPPDDFCLALVER